MFSLRKWIFKPKKSDKTLLAKFFYADEELNMVASELDSFDGRKDPERCTALVNQLRACQDKVLNIIEVVMQDAIPVQRANRDFRVKFPDDVLQESLAGQLWFGAECLAAGSSIMNREVESASMRPLAKALTRHLDYLRSILRDQCLRNLNVYSDKIREALAVFDRLFAEFELSYVSAMVPVKTMREYDMLQEVTVLFCETVQRAMKLGLLSQDMVDDYDPALMFTIPRLAIVSGLLVYPEGPLNPDMDPMNMSEMFRPFQTLLYKIRELLWTLSREELWLLEKSLCSNEEPELDLKDGDLCCFVENLDSPTERYLGERDGICQEDGSEESACDHSAQSECFCGQMTQSDSVMTIVANPNYMEEASMDEACAAADSVQGYTRGGRSRRMHHQDSNDSGMLSEPDQPCTASSLRCSTVEARRLRHSKSWPASRRRHRAAVSNRIQPQPVDDVESPNAYIGSNDFLQADTMEVGSLVRATYRHHSGSHEFGFHLPLNTEISTSMMNEPNIPQISVDEVTSDYPVPQRIIFTSNLAESQEIDAGQQVSFVTDTLGSVFVTDSEFQKTLNLGQEENAESSPTEPDADVPVSVPTQTVNAETSCDTSGSCHVHPTIIVEPSDPDSQVNCSTNIEGDLQINHAKHFEEKGNTETLEKDMSIHELHLNTTNSSKSLESSTDSTGLCSPNELKPNHTRRSSSQCLEVPQMQRLSYTQSMSSSFCSLRSVSPSVGSVDCDWDRESYASSDTSSYNSECHDDEEIALAIQAAELAARQEARARFKSSSDLIHRLFVCISGVADQLQTNYAGDLRHILKSVFDCNSSEPPACTEEDKCSNNSDGSDSGDAELPSNQDEEEDLTPCPRAQAVEEPPAWVPDDQSPHCSSCKVPFTFVRRRHHCRNCGKIFCSRCSSNSVPLPHYGQTKPVRVCNHCFMFQVTPFTMDE